MANKGTCKASGCSQDVHGKGYCARHYRQWRRGKLPKARYRSCNAEGCHKAQVRRGLCADHFAKEYGASKAAGAEPGAAAPAA